MAAMQDESNPNPLNLFYFGNVTPTQAGLVNAFKAARAAEVQMSVALRRRFADELASAMDSSVASMISQEMSVGTIEGDRGTINHSIGGMDVPIEILAVDGRWFVDGSAAMTVTASMAVAMGQDLPGLLTTLTPVMREMTRRIKSGELASLEDVGLAFMEALQRSILSGS